MDDLNKWAEPDSGETEPAETVPNEGELNGTDVPENVTENEDAESIADVTENEGTESIADVTENEGDESIADVTENEGTESIADVTENEGTESIADDTENEGDEGYTEDDLTQEDLDFAGGDLQAYEELPDDESGDDEESENAEESIEDIPDDMLCQRCFARRRDTSANENFEYCAECVEEMAATTVSFGGFLYIMIVAILFAIGGITMLTGAYIALPVVESDMLASQNKLYDAMTALGGAQENSTMIRGLVPESLSENIVTFDIGTKTLYKQIRLIDKSSGTYSAGQTIDSYLANYKLPSDLKKIQSRYAKIEATRTKISELFDEYYNTLDEDGEPTYENLTAILDGAYNEDPDAVDAAFIEYYKYYAANVTGQEPSVGLKHLETIREKYPDMQWLYSSSILELYFLTGDYQSAIDCCDSMLAVNANETYAMMFKGRGLYLLGKKDDALALCDEIEKEGEELSAASIRAEIARREGDFDEAVSLCDAAINEAESEIDKENFNSSTDEQISDSIYRQKTIALLLKGEEEEANKVLSTAYNSGWVSISVDLVELLAITSKKTEDTETYDEVISQLEYNGLELSERAQMCIDGTLTYEQIFMEGEGDL